MKRKLVLLLDTIMMLILASCGADVVEDVESVDVVPQSEVNTVIDTDLFNPGKEGRFIYDTDNSGQITSEECANLMTNFLNHIAIYYEGEEMEGDVAFFSVAIPQSVAPEDYYTSFFDVALIVDGEEIPAQNATVEWGGVHLLAYQSSVVAEGDLADKKLQLRIGLSDECAENLEMKKEDYTRTFEVSREAKLEIQNLEVWNEEYSVQYQGEEIARRSNVAYVIPTPGYYRGTNNDIIWVGDCCITYEFNDLGGENYDYAYSYYVPASESLNWFDVNGEEMLTSASYEVDNYTLTVSADETSFYTDGEFQNEFEIPAFILVYTKDAVYQIGIGEAPFL